MRERSAYVIPVRQHCSAQRNSRRPMAPEGDHLSINNMTSILFLNKTRGIKKDYKVKIDTLKCNA
jgi:hypothetical protein